MATGLEDNVLLNKLFGSDTGGTLGGGDPKKGATPPTPKEQTESQKFGNWLNTTDEQEMAKDLIKRGLVGGDQIRDDQVVPNSPDNIRNRQQDWKLAAIQNIVANAHKLNIRTPEEVDANKNVLIQNGKWVQAINDPAFERVHGNKDTSGNFWQVVNGIIKDQWAKEDAKTKNQTAQK